MKLRILILLHIVCILLVADEFCIWARITFEEQGLAFSDAKNMVMSLPVQPQNTSAGSYIALRFYPPNGMKSSLKKLAVFSQDSTGINGHSITPGEDIIGGELLLLLDHIGNLKAAPDLMLALKLFVPEEDGSEYRLTFWNNSKPGKCSILLSPKRGQWNLVRVPLISPGAIDAGDIVRNATLYSRSSQKRQWLVDDFAVWSGKDPYPPEQVKELKVSFKGDDNYLMWMPSHDNLAIARYDIHRGTVPDFLPNQSTLIGKTLETHFTDVCPMHELSYYKIIAIDYAENPSEPSIAAKR